jgi:hypothetical protein
MAERSLNTILTEINTFIKTVDFGSKITTWGQAYLHEQDGKTFPLLNQGSGQGRKIQWNDTYPLQTYHRILSNTKETNTDLGFGAKPYQERIYEMRLVGIGSKSALSSANYEDNQEICKAVSDALPSFLSGKEYIETGDHEVIKQNIYDEEFANTVELKKLSLEGIAFWIDYTIKIKTC